MSTSTFPSGRSLHIPFEIHSKIIKAAPYQPGEPISIGHKTGKKRRRFPLKFLRVNKAWHEVGMKIVYGRNEFVNPQNASFNEWWWDLREPIKASIKCYTIETRALDAIPHLDRIPYLPGIETLRMEICGPEDWRVVDLPSKIANTIKRLPDRIRNKLSVGPVAYSSRERRCFDRCRLICERNHCPRLIMTAG